MQYRQGDILFETVEAAPKGKAIPRQKGRIVLAEGEVTGHAHVVTAPKIKWIEATDGERYLNAPMPFTIQHEEHGPITLPAGAYRVWHQREYSPEEIRRVAD